MNGFNLLGMARIWASEIQAKAKGNLGNKSKLINIQQKMTGNETRATITLTASPSSVDKYGDVKNVAVAYEYGSGIHGKKRAKYSIKPRRAKLLVFYWEKVGKKVAFSHVNHPGVAAVNNNKGYLDPAVRDVVKTIPTNIQVEIKREVISTFKNAFKQQ